VAVVAVVLVCEYRLNFFIPAHRTLNQKDFGDFLRNLYVVHQSYFFSFMVVVVETAKGDIVIRIVVE
jgi:hypothetical protein